jgi:6,7-dimethyl-8-ribityllumazine synthase
VVKQEPNVGHSSQSDRPYNLPPGRFALVASRFNQHIVERLVAGSLKGLKQQGVAEGDIDLVWVPGAFEIPLVAQKLAQSGNYLALVGLGCVIRGETDHYEYVCQAVTQGTLRVTLDTGLPVIFGILTCDTEEQALDRAGETGNKGLDSALAALDMVTLLNQLSGGKR